MQGTRKRANADRMLLPGSFVEVPGPPHRQRTGHIVREMRYRGFLLDEVVNAADALSRSALARLVATPVVGALGSLPVPGAVREINAQLYSSLAPPLTEKDEKVVAALRKLLAFFAGDLDLEAAAGERAAGGRYSQYECARDRVCVRD